MAARDRMGKPLGLTSALTPGGSWTDARSACSCLQCSRPHLHRCRRSGADGDGCVGITTGLVVVGDLIGSGEAQERGSASYRCPRSRSIKMARNRAGPPIALQAWLVPRWMTTLPGRNRVSPPSRMRDASPAGDR